MFGYIYKTTDLRNNKIYIGQHKSSEYDENYYGSGVIISKLLKKYSKDNFKNEILCECYSEEDLNNKEIEYITFYDSTNPDIGYNIATGGAFGDSGYHLGMLGKHQSDYQKECASKANSYIRNDTIRENMRNARLKSWSNPDYRLKQSNSRKGRTPWNKGKTNCYNQETKEKISNKVSASLKDRWSNMSAEDKSMIGKNISKSKKGTICITDGFKSYFIKPDDWPEYEQKGFYKMSLAKYKKLIDKTM